jgi:hypothetical protein
LPPWFVDKTSWSPRRGAPYACYAAGKPVGSLSWEGYVGIDTEFQRAILRSRAAVEPAQLQLKLDSLCIACTAIRAEPEEHARHSDLRETGWAKTAQATEISLFQCKRCAAEWEFVSRLDSGKWRWLMKGCGSETSIA